jgi:hypothetical protein
MSNMLKTIINKDQHIHLTGDGKEATGRFSESPVSFLKEKDEKIKTRP